MVLFDATFLLLLFHPLTAPPIDPKTSQPVSDAQKRIDYLVKRLEKQKLKIVIPTPALSEILVRAATTGPSILDKINPSSAFKIVPFDIRAAVEVAAMTRKAIENRDKRGGVDQTWAQIKYDRQIVAIGKVENVTEVYSDDGGVRKFAEAKGISVKGVGDLPLPPPEDAQTKISFSGTNAEQQPTTETPKEDAPTESPPPTA